MKTLAEIAGEAVRSFRAVPGGRPGGIDAGDTGAAARMLPQLAYINERMVDAMTTALDRIHPLRARYRFSRMLVKHCRTLLARPPRDTEIVPLAAVEAIANQLHVLAANDWQVFLALIEPLYTVVFPAARWRQRLAAPGGADRAYLDVASDLGDLRGCLELLDAPAPATEERIRAQAFLLMETAQLLDGELAEAA